MGRVVVAGCAIGGMAAALYAARYPGETLALVMSNPAVRIPPAAGENLTRRAADVRRAGMRSLLPQAIDNAFIGYGETAARRVYEARFVDQSAETMRWPALVRSGQTSHLNWEPSPARLSWSSARTTL